MDSSVGSSSSLKKRKRARIDDIGDDSRTSSTSKKEKREKRSKKSSKKDRNSAPRFPQRLSSEDGVELSLGLASEVEASQVVETGLDIVYPTVRVPLPPIWNQHPVGAVAEMFDAMIMRYIPALSGVLLTHSNYVFLSSTARIDSDSAFAVVPVGLKCLVWAPTVGMRLRGAILHSTPSHISLLVHGIFNATITAPHLPAAPGSLGRNGNVSGNATASRAETRSPSGKDAQWEFVYDEGIRSDASEEVQEPEDEQMAVEDGGEGLESPSGRWRDRNMGYWRRKSDGERLGGVDGTLEFTVISMVIANSMLTLNGSILSSPFSVPPPQAFNESSTPAQLIPEIFKSSARRVRWAEDEEYDEEEDDENEAEGSGFNEAIGTESPDASGNDLAPIGPSYPPPSTVTNGKRHKRAAESEEDEVQDGEEEEAERSRRKKERKERKREKERSGDESKEERRKRKEEKKKRKEAR